MSAIRELIEEVERGEWLPLQALLAFGGDGPKIDARRAFDGDMNAALSLMAAVLPGWRVLEIGQSSDGLWHVALERETDLAMVTASGPVLGRALLLAILKAMEARQ